MYYICETIVKVYFMVVMHRVNTRSMCNYSIRYRVIVLSCVLCFMMSLLIIMYTGSLPVRGLWVCPAPSYTENNNTSTPSGSLVPIIIRRRKGGREEERDCIYIYR